MLKRCILNIEGLLLDLLRIPSPMGEENEKITFLENYLSDYSPEIEKVSDSTANIWCRSEGEGPHIVFCAHMDTVPPAPGWNNPYSPLLDGDNIVALGSSDMQAGLAISVELFKHYSDLGANLTLLLTCDEEGWCRGINHALNRIEGDICFIPEPSSEAPVLKAPGRSLYEVTITARGGHATEPGTSALVEASNLILNLEKLEVDGSLAILSLHSDSLGLTHPQEAKLILDRHHYNESDNIKETLLSLSDSISITDYERPTPSPKPYSTPETDLVKKFLSCCKKEQETTTSVGDFNFVATKMPTVILGPEGGNWHAPGEWVSRSSIERVSQIYVDFMNEILSV